MVTYKRLDTSKEKINDDTIPLKVTHSGRIYLTEKKYENFSSFFGKLEDLIKKEKIVKTKVEKNNSKYIINYKGKKYNLEKYDVYQDDNQYYYFYKDEISKLDDLCELSKEKELKNKNKSMEDLKQDIKDLKRDNKRHLKKLLPCFLLTIVLFSLFDIATFYRFILVGILSLNCIYGFGNYFSDYKFSPEAFVDLKHNIEEMKEIKERLKKQSIIEKIESINQTETNGINIDSKKQQEIDKLLNKLKKMLEQEEYQSTVDDIFNERVQLKDDEYTITEEKTANIGSGSIAYAYPKDNIVKKKVLVRK